jgi:hypothetical protein
METVIQEIMQDKIYLDTAGRLVVDGEVAADDTGPVAGPTLDDLK